MDTLTIVAIVSSALSILACITVSHLLKATDGCEDENGFHICDQCGKIIECKNYPKDL